MRRSTRLSRSRTRRWRTGHRRKGRFSMTALCSDSTTRLSRGLLSRSSRQGIHGTSSRAGMRRAVRASRSGFRRTWCSRQLSRRTDASSMRSATSARRATERRTTRSRYVRQLPPHVPKAMGPSSICPRESIVRRGRLRSAARTGRFAGVASRAYFFTMVIEMSPQLS